MINYKNVALAIDFYKERGYKYIEVPWLVSQEAINVTLPTEHNSISTRFGELAGSAEQSFIQLLLNDELTTGKYVTASPCFRDDKLDFWHSRYFFKVELFELYNKHISYLSMVEDALDFFKSIAGKNKISTMYAGIFALDIVINGIEVGSYGRREYKGWTWNYGTGYADPRYSLSTSGNNII